VTRVPVVVERVARLWPSWVMARVSGRTIYWVERYPVTVRGLAHELAHVLQRERLGWRFLGAYLLGWARVGFRYHLNPLEVEAHAAERDPVMLTWAADVIEGRAGG